MNNDNNNMNCDLETGVCETATPENNDQTIDIKESGSKLELHYFTDPICSACYVFDDVLSEFVTDHEDDFDYHIHMGGMIPEKKYLLNPAAGLGSYEDLAKHWQEMGDHFNKPINPKMWLEDPMDSSYPPSIAFKAAELQDANKAQDYLMQLRKTLFEDGLNIEGDDILLKDAAKVGLDVDTLEKDMRGLGVKKFYDDLEFSQSVGVRSFPTLILVNGEQGVQMSGATDRHNLEAFLKQAQEL